MNTFQKLVGHTKTVLKHKYYVFNAMKDCGMPFCGLMHDMSKFSPTEFFESVKYFQGTSSPLNAAKKNKGYSNAFFHHMGRNKHHSLFWVDASFGQINCVKMPYRYFIEHICDTIGAGKAYMKDEWDHNAPINYYKSTDQNSFYNEETRRMVEYCYLYIAIYGWDLFSKSVKAGRIKAMYNMSKNELKSLV